MRRRLLDYRLVWWLGTVAIEASFASSLCFDKEAGRSPSMCCGMDKGAACWEGNMTLRNECCRDTPVVEDAHRVSVEEILAQQPIDTMDGLESLAARRLEMLPGDNGFMSDCLFQWHVMASNSAKAAAIGGSPVPLDGRWYGDGDWRACTGGEAFGEPAVYVMATVDTTKVTTRAFGVCVPLACSEDELREEVLPVYLHDIGVGVDGDVTVREIRQGELDKEEGPLSLSVLSMIILPFLAATYLGVNSLSITAGLRQLASSPKSANLTMLMNPLAVILLIIYQSTAYLCLPHTKKAYDWLAISYETNFALAVLGVMVAGKTSSRSLAITAMTRAPLLALSGYLNHWFGSGEFLTAVLRGASAYGPVERALPRLVGPPSPGWIDIADGLFLSNNHLNPILWPCGYVMALSFATLALQPVRKVLGDGLTSGVLLSMLIQAARTVLPGSSPRSLLSRRMPMAGWTVVVEMAVEHIPLAIGPITATVWLSLCVFARVSIGGYIGEGILILGLVVWMGSCRCVGISKGLGRACNWLSTVSFCTTSTARLIIPPVTAALRGERALDFVKFDCLSDHFIFYYWPVIVFSQFCGGTLIWLLYFRPMSMEVKHLVSTNQALWCSLWLIGALALLLLYPQRFSSTHVLTPPRESFPMWVLWLFRLYLLLDNIDLGHALITTHLFDCHGDQRWMRLRELAVSAALHNWTVPLPLAEEVALILAEADIEATVLDFTDSLVHGTPPTSCLYGIVTALYIDAIITGSADSARIAVLALGKGGVLDFLDSSWWPVRYVDLLAVVSDTDSRGFRGGPAEVRFVEGVARYLQLADIIQLPVLHNRSVRLHAFGTHPSLTLEVVERIESSLAAVYGIGASTAFHGVQYRCEHFRRVCMTSTMGLADGLNSNEDGVNLTMAGYQHLLQGMLSQKDLADADLYVCTGPFVLCGLLHELTKKPLVVYIGLPLLWKAPKDHFASPLAREEFWRLSMRLVSSERVIVACNNPLSSLQVKAQLGYTAPVIRPKADWAARYRWSPDLDKKEVLVVYRHRNEWFLRLAVELVIAAWDLATGGTGLSTSIVYSGVGSDEELTFARISHFWAVFIFPWEHATISLYEFYAKGLPIFIPSDAWLTRLVFQPDSNLASTDFDDKYTDFGVGRDDFGPAGPPLGFGGPFGVHKHFHYLGYSDFLTLPHIGRFASIQDMIEIMSNMSLISLSEVSSAMQRYWQQEVGRGVDYWWRKSTVWISWGALFVVGFLITLVALFALQHRRRAKRGRAKEEEKLKADAAAAKGISSRTRLLGKPERSRSGNRDGSKDRKERSKAAVRGPDPSSLVHPAHREDRSPSTGDKGRSGMDKAAAAAKAAGHHSSKHREGREGSREKEKSKLKHGHHHRSEESFMDQTPWPPLLTAASSVDASSVGQAMDHTPLPLHHGYISDDGSADVEDQDIQRGDEVSLKLGPESNSSLLLEINRLRKAGTWCDVVLTSTDGIDFPAHKVILSSFSSYLSTLLSTSSGFREATTGGRHGSTFGDDVLRLKLESLDAQLLRCIVESAYGCNTALPLERLPELLLAAHRYDMRRILVPTAELLSSVLDTKLCLRLLVECGPVLQDTGPLWTSVSKYAARHFGQLIISPDFCLLPSSMLMLFLLDDDLSGGAPSSIGVGGLDGATEKQQQLTEDQVMFALCKWAAAHSCKDRGERPSACLESLLPLVRFGLMSAACLAMLQSSSLMSITGDPGRSDAVLQSLIRSALQQHLDNRTPANRRSCYPMWRPGTGCGQYEGWLACNWLQVGAEEGSMPIDLVPNEDEGYFFLVDWGGHRVLRIDERPKSKREAGDDDEYGDESPSYPATVRLIAGKGERGTTLEHLSEPMCAVEFDGEVYIADRDNNRIVAWQSNGQGTFGRLVAGSKPGNGMHDLYAPASCQIDRSRRLLYVTDTGNQRVMAYKLAAKGATRGGGGPLKGTVVCGGQGRGSSLSQFQCPIDLAVDSDCLYVCDYGNHRVLRWELSSDGLTAVSGAGQLVAGSHDGFSGHLPTHLHHPCGIALDPVSKALYVADSRLQQWGNGCSDGSDVVAAGRAAAVFNGSSAVEQQRRQIEDAFALTFR
ncbi:hypothetical protein FOL47_001281 [Perkinsus chesapeaki]|uniref:BTB domain-containing protein n=1 Tax=Perkinsus chesapeaki TaxID=330153 RepID=A0A7J6N156_PERCH|nr:hypothetical protein FOL47_001281 [Perkinsus chesapeaki]